MSVIEHWLADRPRTPPVVVASGAGAENYRADGWRVTGPYVLAEQLEGAVGRLTEWADSLDLYASTHDGSPEMVRAVAVEMRAAAGGQSPRPARTSRTRARSVECPHCGAGPGEACIGARGKPRASMHRERHDAIGGP